MLLNYKTIILILLIIISNIALANRDFLVDSDWLLERIDNKNLVILEIRYYPHRYNTIGHIPSAQQVKRLSDLGNLNANIITHFPDKKSLQNNLRAWGVNNNSTIVIYDDAGTVLAARLYFLLELYGFNMQQVKILNDAIYSFSAFEDLTKDIVAITKGDVTLFAANEELAINWQDIYNNIIAKRNDNIILIDARDKKMYNGDVRDAINAGHIPGAINIDSMFGIKDYKWSNAKNIAKIYKDIDKNKIIYLYCNDGYRMSLSYMQLKSLGYKNIKLYNGGWAHWGNNLVLPAVIGDNPYTDEYNL